MLSGSCRCPVSVFQGSTCGDIQGVGRLGLHLMGVRGGGGCIGYIIMCNVVIYMYVASHIDFTLILVLYGLIVQAPKCGHF